MEVEAIDRLTSTVYSLNLMQLKVLFYRKRSVMNGGWSHRQD